MLELYFWLDISPVQEVMFSHTWVSICQHTYVYDVAYVYNVNLAHDRIRFGNFLVAIKKHTQCMY